MSRLPLAALFLSILAFGATGLSFWRVSAQQEKIQSGIATLSQRLASLESVYESSECVLTTEEDGGCELGDGSHIFLSIPERDGEVRALRRIDKEGRETKIGLLPQEASYVRVKRTDGSLEGYLSDTEIGYIEIYAARPALSMGDEERLPMMMKSLLKKE